MPNANYLNGGKIYSPYVDPTLLTCNFIVDSTNGNGLGQRSLKGQGIKQVFMNTSPAATTATSVFASGVLQVQVSSVLNLVPGMVVTDSTTGGNITGGTTIVSVYPPTNTITLSAVTAGASAASPGDTLSFAMTAALAGNPNPAAGIIVVQLAKNFARYLAGFSGFVSPLTGSNVVVGSTGLTAGKAYVITSLGTSTAANFVALGLPLGYTAAVGATFIATGVSNTGKGTGTVQLASVSGAFSIEAVGDANQTLQGQTAAGPTGGQIILQILAPTVSGSAYDTPMIPTAPASGTVIGLSFYLTPSMVQVKGQ